MQPAARDGMHGRAGTGATDGGRAVSGATAPDSTPLSASPRVPATEDIEENLLPHGATHPQDGPLATDLTAQPRSTAADSAADREPFTQRAGPGLQCHGDQGLAIDFSAEQRMIEGGVRTLLGAWGNEERPPPCEPPSLASHLIPRANFLVLVLGGVFYGL